MRRKVIAGNWKMNMTPSQAVKLVTELRPNVNNPDVDVVIPAFYNRHVHSDISFFLKYYAHSRSVPSVNIFIYPVYVPPDM